MESYTYGSEDGINAVIAANEQRQADSGETYAMTLSRTDFETVLRALVTAWHQGSDEAGSLASDIATTLGVEWV
jgi:hypothetical protein